MNAGIILKFEQCSLNSVVLLYEHPHDKTNKMMCAQQRLRSAWAFQG